MTLATLIERAERYEAKFQTNNASLHPGLIVLRKDRPSAIEAVVYNPVVCLILRGAKETAIGRMSVALSAGDALVVSHELPVVSKITQASSAAPYLAIVLSLDLTVVRSLYEQVGADVPSDSVARSLSAGAADPIWADALERYLVAVETPLEADVLGPLILRELHFRLLMSSLGGMLRNLLAVDSHASRVARAISRIRADFRQPLAVPDLAQLVGMSASSFHEHFKAVTGTTPLQYQKDLRMIEARGLLQGGNWSVSAASFEVGYESPAQFSREYTRKFGIPPSRDTGRVSLQVA
ncbi:MAG: helix-turn-helix domain-containing protein [Boseongicola sp.]|nr:MAG: helix-turn-helix domain-containing protein [Boseongicola sp.]